MIEADEFQNALIQGEERVVGFESPLDAWAAVQDVLERDPRLAGLIQRARVPDPSTRVRPVRSCSQCTEGRLHPIGGHRLPSGRPGTGELLLCDRCGYYATRR